jgi:hypothetical protein
VFPQIENKCGITSEHLKAATQMSTRLARLRGEDQLSQEAVEDLTEERKRAFTQVIRAYDEARAVIAFLRRREGDAEQITPNLYIANTRRRKTLASAAKPSPKPSAPPESGSFATAGTPPSETADAAEGSPTVPKTSSPKTSSPVVS